MLESLFRCCNCLINLILATTGNFINDLSSGRINILESHAIARRYKFAIDEVFDQCCLACCGQRNCCSFFCCYGHNAIAFISMKFLPGKAAACMVVRAGGLSKEKYWE